MPLIFAVIALVFTALAVLLINVCFPGAGKAGAILNWSAAVCLSLGLLKAFDWLRDIGSFASR